MYSWIKVCSHYIFIRIKVYGDYTFIRIKRKISLFYAIFANKLFIKKQVSAWKERQ